MSRGRWKFYPFELEAGQRVEVSTTGAINVWMMGEPAYRMFERGKRCDAIGGRTKEATQTFHLRAPRAGLWFVVFAEPQGQVRFGARALPIPLHDLVAVKGTGEADMREVDVILRLPMVSYRTLHEIATALGTDATSYLRDVVTASIVVGAQRVAAQAEPDALVPR